MVKTPEQNKLLMVMQKNRRLTGLTARSLAAVTIAIVVLISAPRAMAQGATALDSEAFRAAFQGNAQTLGELLQKGANPEAVSNTGMPLIGVAITSKNADTVAVVLDAQAAVANQIYHDSRNQVMSPLIYAIMQRQPAIVDLLLKAGAKLDWSASNGLGPLEAAVLGDDADDLHLLLAAGANLKKSIGRHGSLLQLAAYRERPAMIRELLADGLDPNQRDDYGFTALDQAAGAGTLENARVLLEAGAWAYPLDAYGLTAVGYAKQIKDPDTARAMLDLLTGHGAPSSGKNRPIDAQYLEAAWHGDLPGVKAAISKGADVNARRILDMDWPMSEVGPMAVRHPEVLEYLLAHGLNVNACNRYGFTALFSAAGRDADARSITLLVKNGADVNQKAAHGETPLYFAVNMNHPAGVEQLLKLGADPTVNALNGMSLLQFARTGNRSALIVPLLLQYGAKDAGTS